MHIHQVCCIQDVLIPFDLHSANDFVGRLFRFCLGSVRISCEFELLGRVPVSWEK